MRRWIWLPIAIIISAVVLSLTKSRPPTLGENILTAMEHAAPNTRSAILLFDYTPNQTAVAQTMRETLERGSGIPTGYGLDSASPSDKQWIKTANALFFWSPSQHVSDLRHSLNTAHDQLVLAFAHGPLDDAATDAAFITARAQLDALSDESLLLNWINADRGVLAALNDPPAALRQALLLRAAPDPGPILVFNASHEHIYLIPETPTADLTWCTLQGYAPTSSLSWTGTLRINGHPPAERIRTLAVTLVQEALTPPAKPAPTDTPLLMPF